MSIWNKYQQIPFIDGGRNYTACDCWGLIRLIYIEELNIKLPSYGDISAFDLIKVARKITKGAEENIWSPVDSKKEGLKKFDICLMAEPGKSVLMHVGLVINANTIIHTEEGVGVLCQRLFDPIIKRRILGFRRYKNESSPL